MGPEDVCFFNITCSHVVVSKGSLWRSWYVQSNMSYMKTWNDNPERLGSLVQE